MINKNYYKDNKSLGFLQDFELGWFGPNHPLGVDSPLMEEILHHRSRFHGKVLPKFYSTVCEREGNCSQSKVRVNLDGHKNYKFVEKIGSSQIHKVEEVSTGRAFAIKTREALDAEVEREVAILK